jgi:hypothetical protein
LSALQEGNLGEILLVDWELVPSFLTMDTLIFSVIFPLPCLMDGCVLQESAIASIRLSRLRKIYPLQHGSNLPGYR